MVDLSDPTLQPRQFVAPELLEAAAQRLAAARGFTQKTRSGESRHELRNAAQMVVGEQVRVKQALGNLYPDLVA